MADSAMPGPKLAGFSTRIFGLRIANSGYEFDADATFRRDHSVGIFHLRSDSEPSICGFWTRKSASRIDQILDSDLCRDHQHMPPAQHRSATIPDPTADESAGDADRSNRPLAAR